VRYNPHRGAIAPGVDVHEIAARHSLQGSDPQQLGYFRKVDDEAA
jgi:hypothetical protein